MLNNLFKNLVCIALIFSLLSSYAFAQDGTNVTDATFSSIIMNVGSDETNRNLTWYSQYCTSGEVRYAKVSEMINGEFPADYSVAKAIAVSTTAPGLYAYKATLTSLEENTSYVYRLVTGSTVSNDYTFDVHSFDDEFSFAFITDAQVNTSADGASWSDTLDTLSSKFSNISFIVSGGDQTSNPTSENNYGYFISKQLSSVAVATTVGPSHDNASLYADHYNLPNLSSSYGVSSTSSDYSYKYNNILFMHINVENTDYDGHIKFMQNAIADNPDCIWKIAIIHYSFFTGGHHSTSSSTINFRKALAGKINEMGIDVVLGGHDHLYSRSNMMKDGYTVSDDIVTDNSVNDPSGTLYLCGTSPTGASYYTVDHNDDDSYIACRRDDDRKSVVIFDSSESSLSMNAYFVDGNTPEKFDSFTINKSAEVIRLNKSTDMLEFTNDGGITRVPLVNAYTSAKVQVVDGYWALSTDGGNTYKSLGISSDESSYILQINSSTGYWEFSVDGGKSFEPLPFSINVYSVRYITLPDAEYGDNTDISSYSPRRFAAETPDAPVISLPSGSVSEGYIYDWHWEYYSADGNGTPITEFEYGNVYNAYLVRTATPVSDTIYIATKENPAEYTYTWYFAWEIAQRCREQKFNFILKENIILTSSDAVLLTTSVNVTIDLCGYALNASAVNPAVNFSVGSSGSIFSLTTSRENGTVNANSSNFLKLASNAASTINIQFGSESTYPITVDKCKYLVYADGSFKHKSILNLGIYNGSYTVTDGIIYITNVSATAAKNIYTIKAKNAQFKFNGSSSCMVRSAGENYHANADSNITANECTFKNTYDTSSRCLIRENRWHGTASFKNCAFDGISLDASILTNAGNFNIGEGCTFVNSAKTFTGNPLSLSGNNLVLEDNCVIARTDANGSAEILNKDSAVAVTWSNPVGYTDYWKKGVLPSYLGETFFTTGSISYSLLPTEEIVVAHEDKTYSFKTSEGYLFRFDTENDIWLISRDGGNTYTDITVPSSYGCQVIIDGEDSYYDAGTDFYDILEKCDVSGNKEINIVLCEDFTLSSTIALKNATNYKLNLDLAGNALNINGKLSFSGAGFDVKIYSSSVGGKLIFGSDYYLQPEAEGTITIGSEDYQNFLTVTTAKRLVNIGSIYGGNINISYLYSNITTGNLGILRLNARGGYVATLKANIIGCTISSYTSPIFYNNSTNLGSNANGGIFGVDSYINIKDSRFTCTANAPSDFFGHSNFKDRYFGKVNFEGCTIDKFIINGEGIYSDSDVDYTYNSYPSSLPEDYDPTKCITIGKDCIFYNYGSTFDDSLTAFADSNVNLKKGYKIVSDGDCVKTVITFAILDYNKESSSISLALAESGTYTLILADYEDSILNNVGIVNVTAENDNIIITLTSDITLGTEDNIMLWNNITDIVPLCEEYIVQ